MAEYNSEIIDEFWKEFERECDKLYIIPDKFGFTLEEIQKRLNYG